jgi:hypothetical protein
MKYQSTQPERPFTRTNRQTIHHRANLLGELGYERLFEQTIPPTPANSTQTKASKSLPRLQII